MRLRPLGLWPYLLKAPTLCLGAPAPRTPILLHLFIGLLIQRCSIASIFTILHHLLCITLLYQFCTKFCTKSSLPHYTIHLTISIFNFLITSKILYCLTTSKLFIVYLFITALQFQNSSLSKKRDCLNHRVNEEIQFRSNDLSEPKLVILLSSPS